ncbi:hypothetical protein NQ317_018454, partial [Molorchus minor]
QSCRRPTITEYPPPFALPHCPRFTKNIKVQNLSKGSFQKAALIIFPSTPIKKHERWNEKMAETGQGDGKQNIRIEGAAEGALLLIQYKRQ